MSRPYLEIKVVKVKKYIKKQVIEGRLYGYYYNKKGILCFEKIKPYTKPKQLRKGNWVNGECIDKIKFPCLCWYLSGTGKRYCELDFIQYDKGFYRVRELKQCDIKDSSRAEFWNFSLKSLINSLNLHILKGKIILFEEEE